MGDPTAVMGRRLVAGTIDYFLLPFGIAAAVFAATVDLVERSSCAGISNCVEVTTNGSTDYYVVDGPIGVVYLTLFGVWFLNLVLLQSATGASLGKLALGLRTVDETGATAGFAKVLVRQILWVVDGIGCVVPLVGPITGLASKGHRRVGDMAAKTNVVATASVGTPPMPGVVPGGYATPAATPPAPGAGWAAPQPAPGDGWAAPAAPGAATAPPGPEPAAPDPSTAAPAVGGTPGEPQWDPARNAYIQWDGIGERWMAYDQDAGEWRPIT